jgi:signal transduction histidine kinase
MAQNPEPSSGRKPDMAKIYPYAFLGAAALFICWVSFLLHCPPRQKLTLLGAFAAIEILSFFYYKTEINNTIKIKKAGMDATITEIKDCQKMLVNDKISAAVSKFASVISHELKNPLSSLKNIAYYLIKTSSGNDDPKSKRMMEILSSEVDRVDRMIGEFSDISHAKMVTKTLVNISELFENILGGYAIVPSIELKKDIEPSIEANVDPERISAVLKNLLKNAVYASGEKGRVSVSLKKVGAFFELVVADAGTGIDNDILGHIFEPMFTTKTKSLGLGLTVVNEAVSGHDGKIDVETEKGKGSTFRVFIPID